MRLEFSIRQSDATDIEKEALKDRVERKIQKVTRFLREPIEVGMHLTGQRRGYHGELVVTAAGEPAFKAKVESDDPIAAVDGLIHTVERAVRRSHDRRVHKNRKGAPQTDGFVPTELVAPVGFALADDEDVDLETAEIEKPAVSDVA